MSRVAVVKPEKARGVEELLINMARSGRLPGRVNEDRLVELLGQIQNQTQPKMTITVRVE